MQSSSVGPAPRFLCRPQPSERFVLPSVRLFDPSLGLDTVGDLVVADGRIEAAGAGAPRPDRAEVLESYRGCTVFPGFVDMHAHLRSPGQEYKEDVASAARAAAAGGYVMVVGMANTAPPVDSGPLAAWVLEQAVLGADVLVGQVGAVSRGLRGEELAELRELVDAGVAAFSDDGHPVVDSDLLLMALRYLRGTGRPVLLHVEDRSLSIGGSMHEGAWSARLGIRGIPGAAESGPLAQALEILRHTCREAEASATTPARAGTSATPVHFQHLSAADSVRLVGRAKSEGLPVTAEVSPHHLLLTDERVRSFDQNLKMNPPLRSAADRDALVAGLAEGIIDCVATDHAPHAPHEKEVPFEDAPFGTVGLETAFAALYGGLVTLGRLSLARLIDALSAAPCRCLGIEPPQLVAGAPARFCVVDLDEEWVVGPDDLAGKSRNSAFLGEWVQGRVLLTVVEGTRRFVRDRSV
jgi:dihydroorotase